MAGSQTIGQVLGKRVAQCRERAGYSQKQLAERLSNLGFDIGRVAIANIEAAGREDSTAKNRTRADNATLVDVLALALALSVPPAWLFIPLGDTEEVQVGGVRMHPHSMLRWVSGDEMASRLSTDDERSADVLGTIGVGNRERWNEAAMPVRMFRQLDAVSAPVYEASALRQRIEDRQTMAAEDGGAWGTPLPDHEYERQLAEVQQVLDRHLRELDRHHRYMKTAGLSVPEVPDSWAARIMYLRSVDEGGDR